MRQTRIKGRNRVASNLGFRSSIKTKTILSLPFAFAYIGGRSAWFRPSPNKTASRGPLPLPITITTKTLGIYQPFLHIAKGIFHVTLQCLITLNPVKAMRRFVDWTLSNKRRFAPGTPLYEVVGTGCKVAKNWQTMARRNRPKQCSEILRLVEKYADENHLCAFVRDIALYALRNLELAGGRKILFTPSDPLADVGYWKRKMSQYGTGIIRYLDTVLMHGSQEHIEQMQESFHTFLSCSVVVSKMLSNERATCPFLDEIPICRASFRGDSRCDLNPFLMGRGDGHPECLFANGVLLTGFAGRLNFSQTVGKTP